MYAVTATWSGKALKGVANLGVRPTIRSAAGERVLEVHLFDFEREIYGEDIEVTFRRLLRPEQKFPTLEALREQISRDVSEARGALE